MFNHLHVHTHYSLLDGLASPSILAKGAKDLGMSAMAITDHGVMHGVIDFYLACKEQGIKPIIGMEAYVAPVSREYKISKKGDITAYHLTLLAKNQEGYRNLMQLSTLGFVEGFYYKPRIDLEILQRYKEGIVCLSGCLSGYLAKTLIKREYDNAINYINQMIIMFGEDFYLELQDNGIEEQGINNDWLCGIKHQKVATNDVHYLDKEDAFVHDALLCIGTGTNIYVDKRMKMPTNQYYLKSEQEMLGIFNKKYLDTSVEIAEKCNVEIQLKNKMHIYDPNKAIQKLKEICDDKLADYPTYYKNRYDTELEAIEKTGYAEYILVVADFIAFAKLNNIPIGSGRGSSAGSLICYLLGITNIDPIHYGLLFERFINADRIEPPDIDVDICQARRQEVIEYIKNEYGSDKVAQIITFGTLKAKAAIRDTWRVLQLKYEAANTLTKLIPDMFDGGVEDALNLPEVDDFLMRTCSPEDNIKLRKIAIKIEGKPRHSSTHAAGIVISNEPLIDITPLCIKNGILTQYDMGAIERLGLLKFDILGLRTLTVIHDACKLAGIIVDKIPLNDFFTYQMLRHGNTFGIFQYEGWGYTKFIKKMQPMNFEHLIALGALYRPGCLDSGTADEYIKRMHNPEYTSNEEILKDTYGIMLYQEQVMLMAVKYAGFSMNQADHLRKAIGKKDKELMDKVLIDLKYCMHDKGHTNEDIREFIDKITTFARYGWNKAHSVCYAILSYQTAYLKQNHPIEYYCALLNSEMEDKDRVTEIMAHAAHVTKIELPHINISTKAFRLHNKKLYSGIMSIKGIGEKAADAIMIEREKGEFQSAADLRQRIPPKSLNSNMMKVLMEAQAFRSEFGKL